MKKETQKSKLDQRTAERIWDIKNLCELGAASKLGVEKRLFEDIANICDNILIS